jgi:hypothetical protein
MKTFSIKFLVLGSAFAFVGLTQVHAQGAGAKLGPDAVSSAPSSKFGPPPAHSAQQKILSRALSPSTRHTLQDAIDSGN